MKKSRFVLKKKGFIFSAIVKGEEECWLSTPANVTGVHHLAIG